MDSKVADIVARRLHHVRAINNAVGAFPLFRQ